MLTWIAVSFGWGSPKTAVSGRRVGWEPCARKSRPGETGRAKPAYGVREASWSCGDPLPTIMAERSGTAVVTVRQAGLDDAAQLAAKKLRNRRHLALSDGADGGLEL